MPDLMTDSDDDKAVEEILSQAMDLTVLEQVAAINCAGFTDSGLPSHLETRFQKLKSFPSSTAKNRSYSTKSFNYSDSEFKKSDFVDETKKSENIEGFSEPMEKKQCEKKGDEKEYSTCLNKWPEDQNRSSPIKSSENGAFSPVKKNPRIETGKNELKSPSSSKTASWEEFSSDSLSPPVKKTGCFLCSPKPKVSRKKIKENKGLDLELDWGKNDSFLSDLSNFSIKSQRKMMEKAMKDEEDICREAEKIVQWAKRASARMDVSGIEDELSDDENVKFP